MDAFKLTFLKPGLHPTVQAQGRLGFQYLGVPINGVMDKHSANLANDLVDNESDAPLFEITLIGPRIQFSGKGQISITGAALTPQLNGKVIEMYTTLEIVDGDLLEFAQPIEGCRAYLAVGGVLKVQQWLGSASASDPKTFTPQSLIQSGASFIATSKKKTTIKSIPLNERPIINQQLKIRVMKGPEFHEFPKKVINHFFKYWFQISKDANRMGYRLDKTLPGFKSEIEVISSGIVPGTIQITNSGQPIVLMADAQTSGGYMRIANVLTKDLDKVAQLKPGDLIGFELVEY
jgi:antagonist of KipI